MRVMNLVVKFQQYFFQLVAFLLGSLAPLYGNVFNFVMEYENYTFGEALKHLADRAGVQLPKIEYSGEAKKKAERRAALLEINKLAAGYFYYQLRRESGRQAHEYLTGRGLSEETIRKFGLGYSDKYSDDLYKYLKSKNYSDELLRDSGLFNVDERRGMYDKFWNRVIFPIMDVNNRVIGFGGRVMGDGEPKYLNSPETRLFDKSRNLYGLNYARTTREKYMLVCEGYLDVISMHQAGFTNAVASLGTAFTSQHAGVLKRYTDQVILTYDSDGAGVKAALDKARYDAASDAEEINSKLHQAQEARANAEKSESHALDMVKKLEKQLSDAKAAEKSAKEDLKKAKNNPDIPESIMERLRKEAEAKAAEQAAADVQKRLDAAQSKMQAAVKAKAAAEAAAKEAQDKLVAAQKAEKISNPDVMSINVLGKQLLTTWNTIKGHRIKAVAADPANAEPIRKFLQYVIAQMTGDMEA